MQMIDVANNYERLLYMINRIRLHQVATYSDPVEINLKKINFIYGGNGTGKTTISNVISGM